MARQVEHMVYEEKLRKNVGGFLWLVGLVFFLSLKKRQNLLLLLNWDGVDEGKMDTGSDSPQWCMLKEGQNPQDTTQEIPISKDRLYFTIKLVKHQ